MGVDDGLGKSPHSSDAEEEEEELDHNPSAPAQQRVSTLARDDFQNGLCSCLDDVEICLCSFLCPCVQFGQNWSKLIPTKQNFLTWCGVYFGTVVFLDAWFFLLPSTFLRSWSRGEFRRALGYRDRPMCDFMSALCCPCCMIAQDANEIKALALGKLG